jgi:hypothetical protein
LENEFKEIEATIKAKEAEFIEEKPPELVPLKRSYVICADTLGQDQEFSASTIEFVTGLAEHFRANWERKELELLQSDVLNQVEYLKGLSSPP